MGRVWAKLSRRYRPRKAKDQGPGPRAKDQDPGPSSAIGCLLLSRMSVTLLLYSETSVWGLGFLAGERIILVFHVAG